MIDSIGKIGTLEWIDVVAPTQAELFEIAERFALHPNSVQDCLDPEHFPKYEDFESFDFVIVRSYDNKCDLDAGTVQELTRKLAIFIKEGHIITIHRTDQDWLSRVKDYWRKKFTSSSKDVNSGTLVCDLLRASIATYSSPIELAQENFEALEERVFQAHRAVFDLSEAYFIKRRVAIYRRMLRMVLDIVPRVKEFLPQKQITVLQDLREAGDRLLIYADELTENVNALMHLQISLESQKTNEASHRTNEVMRVLTVFSVFFLPLNFVASIYGMNFEFMPELHWPFGYHLILFVMALIATSVYVWFRRSGWLSRAPAAGK